MTKKHSYEYVKEIVEKEEGYKLFSKEYKGAHSKLKIQCSEGHIYEVSFDGFKNSGNRCPYCYGNAKLSYKYIKNFIEKEEGFLLLSEEYKGVHSKLKIQCNKGHQYNVSFNTFQQGHRCLYCYGKAKHSYKFVKEFIEKEGYKLLSEEYENNRSKLKIQCDKGHQYNVSFNTFQQGHRCLYCYGNIKYSYEYVKSVIEKEEGYKLLSKKYKNSGSKLKVQCPEGHIYKTTFNIFKNNGSRCPVCINNAKRNEDTLVWNDWTYGRIHYTIRQLKPKPKKCEVCGKKLKRLECSYNLPHWNSNPLYYSLNPNHYTYKCSGCHQTYDKNAFWSKWSKEQIQEYTKNLKILKKNWPHIIERKIIDGKNKDKR